ncbi:MAG: hypothetical protein AB8G99_13480 [Planctomycetaceae bacterium]
MAGEVMAEAPQPNDSGLKAGQWYWIRRKDGAVVPYRFHKVREQPYSNKFEGEFFVGSMICVFPLSAVVAEAQAPRQGPAASSTSG